MDNHHGGKRNGAGRKTNVELIQIKSLLDNKIDREFVVSQLFNMISAGDYRAIELYMKYRWGVPTKMLDVSIDTSLEHGVVEKKH